MPRAERQAEVVWEGSSARGAGSLTALSSGTFAAIPFTEPSRIGEPEGKTSPEELLAGAHAACFAMSLAAELTKERMPPERLDVRATVAIDEIESGDHRVVSSQLAVRVRVPGLEQARLDDVARRADEGCPFSALIKASAEVTIDARLED